MTTERIEKFQSQSIIEDWETFTVINRLSVSYKHDYWYGMARVEFTSKGKYSTIELEVQRDRIPHAQSSVGKPVSYSWRDLPPSNKYREKLEFTVTIDVMESLKIPRFKEYYDDDHCGADFRYSTEMASNTVTRRLLNQMIFDFRKHVDVIEEAITKFNLAVEHLR